MEIMKYKKHDLFIFTFEEKNLIGRVLDVVDDKILFKVIKNELKFYDTDRKSLFKKEGYFYLDSILYRKSRKIDKREATLYAL